MSRFDATSTAAEVLDGIDLSGKRVLVTGVSAGLGVETARVIAARGASVVGAARNLDKARAVTEGVVTGDFALQQLDLADLASVRGCADSLIADGRAFDLVVANAGVMATPEGRTVDGFETQLGTNHLGHFALVNRIASLLQRGARLVSLSSAGHRLADVDFDDPGFERSPYDRWVAYGRSKTANILFAVAFDKRHRDRGVRAVAVHPGTIQTDLYRHMTEEEVGNTIASIKRARPENAPPFRSKTVPQGAATSVWAGVVAPADEVGGRYCEDCHVVGVADVGGTRVGVRPYAVDPAHAEALWARSEQLVGETF